MSVPMLYTEDWTVVVVEDEEDSAQVVSQILKYHGIEVFVAHNGWECLKTLSLIKANVRYGSCFRRRCCCCLSIAINGVLFACIDMW